MNPILQSSRFGLDERASCNVIKSSTLSMMSNIIKTERTFPTGFQFLVVAIIECRLSEEDQITVLRTSGKKIIASLASGRTRRSRRFRRNLLNSEADRHGTVRPDAVRHGICLPDGAWQGIIVLDARCQGIFLLDAAVSGHFPSGRNRVRAFSFWTQPCQGIFLLDAAMSGHFPSGL